MKRTVILIILLALLGMSLIGCGGSDTPYKYDGVEMLQNGSVESDGIWTPKNTGTEYARVIDTATGTYSLEINTTDTQNTQGCFWSQTITDIPVGKQLKLTAKIKTNDITGMGVSIVIRCDDTATCNGNAEMFTTTEGKVSIVGTNNWTQYQAELTDKVTPNIKSITVFLVVLSGSGGTVWFDDISLIH